MKILKKVSAGFIVVLVAACSQLPVKEAEVKGVKEVKIAEIEQALNERVAYIVDARKLKPNYLTIKGSINVPYTCSNEEIAKALPDKNRAIYIFCGDYKCPVGLWLAKRLVKLDYTHINHYAGGFAEWRDAGKRVVAHKLNSRPITN